MAFEWTQEVDESIKLFQKGLTEALIFVLPDFNKTFELDYDASGMGIGWVLNQGGQTIPFFSEDLNDA